MIRESFTLILATFLPLSLDRVSVHVERQEIRGLSEKECTQFKLDAKRTLSVKARCVREGTRDVK